MRDLGFVRVGAATPKMRVADADYNTEKILSLVNEALKKGIKIIVFPELCITGYTCGDLFFQKELYESNLRNVDRIVKFSATEKDIVIIIGFYLIVEDMLFNCGGVIHNGKIHGVVPKKYLPNHNEFYEKRWFVSGFDFIKKIDSVKINGDRVPFGNIIFENKNLSFSLEICEELWAAIPPSSQLCVNGAKIIFNLSASNEIVSKSNYRKKLVSMQSAKNICGYVYSSSGVNESTTDLVFGGETLIFENGILLKEGGRFSRESKLVYSEIDLDKLVHDRINNKTFSECSAFNRDMSIIKVDMDEITYDIDEFGITREFSKSPFVPFTGPGLDERCEEIFQIQTNALAKRLSHTNIKNAVIGISGGLDSTLALLVSYKTFKLLKADVKNIIGITMPGFGTSGQTYKNALNLMKKLGITHKEISIKEAVLQHFKDINHDPSITDVTYENSQARERTQILMDIANEKGALVIGTGDLSEAALGWSTYNGDHMSMYSVNFGVPKTLVKFVIKWLAEKSDFMDGELKELLTSILDTPISPELLPVDETGKIIQKTEMEIGPYVLNDFFLFHFIRNAYNPEKILYLSKYVFEEEYSYEFLKNSLVNFYKRFFSQQFKRSCVPDGPKVGTVSLSPRGDWRMPSDAEVSAWLKKLK
jgi:NAD+ synthase (glutamine-hydrolysing)